MGGEEKRRAVCYRILKDGKIVMMNNWSVIDCCVRDLSATGARIRCQDLVPFPTNSGC